MSERPAAHAAPLLVFGSALFGLGSLIVKFVAVGSYAIAFWRLAVAAVLFLILARALGHPFPRAPKAIGFALLAGVFLAFDLALWHESIHAVGPGISTLLNSLQIFFLTAIGFFYYGERPRRIQLISLLLAVLGVGLISSPELGQNQRAPWGIVSGIASGALLALSMLSIRKTHQTEKTSLFPLMMLLSCGGALALIGPALYFNGEALYPRTARDIGLVLIYGAVMQCVAWGLIAYAVPLLPLTLTGLLLLSEPVAALLLDYFYLHKPINGLQWGGAGLTLAAIYLGSGTKR